MVAFRAAGCCAVCVRTSGRIEPDHVDPRGFRVVLAGVSQSWVDPADPLRLEYEYVQCIADMLEEWVFPRGPAPAVLHIGGGGMTLPRYVAARRPDARQVVCEPDAAQVAEVLARAPLPAGDIRVETVDGLSWLTACEPDEFDAVIVDAFVGLCVPAELGTSAFFAAVRRALTPDGQMLANIAGKAPFAWERRYIAGVRAAFRHVVVTAEAPVWRGRRYGNLVVHASTARHDPDDLNRRAAASAFGYRVVADGELRKWLGGVQPFTEPVTPDASPRPWFS